MKVAMLLSVLMMHVDASGYDPEAGHGAPAALDVTGAPFDGEDTALQVTPATQLVTPEIQWRQELAVDHQVEIFSQTRQRWRAAYVYSIDEDQMGEWLMICTPNTPPMTPRHGSRASGEPQSQAATSGSSRPGVTYRQVRRDSDDIRPPSPAGYLTSIALANHDGLTALDEHGVHPWFDGFDEALERRPSHAEVSGALVATAEPIPVSNPAFTDAMMAGANSRQVRLGFEVCPDENRRVAQNIRDILGHDRVIGPPLPPRPSKPSASQAVELGSGYQDYQSHEGSSKASSESPSEQEDD